MFDQNRPPALILQICIVVIAVDFFIIVGDDVTRIVLLALVMFIEQDGLLLLGHQWTHASASYHLTVLLIDDCLVDFEDGACFRIEVGANATGV